MVKNLTEINELVEEIIKLIISGLFKLLNLAKKLMASEVRYYVEFQEYPNTPDTGFSSQIFAKAHEYKWDILIKKEYGNIYNICQVHYKRNIDKNR
ncbi:hypothetical protein RclHR1_09620008 [Rhizophagus clarus]|uniref:Uncharacterized protein n=1 Tax=Rhizophagus clarus TaxID=94130 RepID=A0A2Z6SF44_9GLOM|nr:hypothetical protein RclHR1_09620008 [Rhizophagus clarus]